MNLSRQFCLLTLFAVLAHASIQVIGQEGSDFKLGEKVDIFASEIRSRAGSTGFDYHVVDWCTGNKYQNSYDHFDDRTDKLTEYVGTQFQYEIGQSQDQYSISCTRRFNET